MTQFETKINDAYAREKKTRRQFKPIQTRDEAPMKGKRHTKLFFKNMCHAVYKIIFIGLDIFKTSLSPQSFFRLVSTKSPQNISYSPKSPNTSRFPCFNLHNQFCLMF